jgi:hypothetical protein
MKNHTEKQSAEPTTTSKSETRADRAPGPRSGLTAESRHNQPLSSATERTTSRRLAAAQATDQSAAVGEKGSAVKSSTRGAEVGSRAVRPRDSILGQNRGGEGDASDRAEKNGRSPGGGGSSDSVACKGSDKPAKEPTEAVRSGRESIEVSAHKDSVKLIKPGEQLKVQGSDATLSKAAWDNPGSFVVTNPDARTTRIEGFVSPQDSKRTSAEARLQREAASRGGMAEKDQEWVGGHRIADVLGGPRVATHGKEASRANLEPSDSRINGSMIKALELAVLHELQSSPGKRLFMQVDTRSDPDGKQWITHRVFDVDKDGKPKGRPVKEVQTREDIRPSMTAGEAVKGVGGGPASTLHTTRTGGTHRSRHGDH